MLLIELKQQILKELVAGNKTFREKELGVSSRFFLEAFLSLENDGYISFKKNQRTPTYIYTVVGTCITKEGLQYIRHLEQKKAKAT